MSTPDNHNPGHELIGIEIPWLYDGVLYWICPACRVRIHRWSEGHPLRAKAERYWENHGIDDEMAP